jgi:hypothetical protein
MRFRLPQDDDMKSVAVIKRQQLENLICCVDGCDNPISTFKGPGSHMLCRDHQVKQREYGGMGRYDRPHTFHRDWVCIECGVNFLEDPRIQKISDPVDQRRVARILMHGDHEIPKAGGGNDSSDNVRGGKCVVCHAIKTVLNRDYIRPSFKKDK